jgi:hypothetical protein
MEFNTYEYVEPQFKNVIATGEYAAHYWFEQGWKACRLASFYTTRLRRHNN